MLNRNSRMGGSEGETKALQELEKLRSQLMQRCRYQNECNWVLSVSSMNRVSLSKLLFYNDIVQQLTNIPGVILELGVQWGALTSLLANLTSIHDPFNFRRKIVGFDTFEGFPPSSLMDSEKEIGWNERGLAASSDAKEIIDRTLCAHQQFAALSHIKRHELVVGDVCETVPRWLEENPFETIAMCIFDLDLGIPTEKSLREVLGRSQKGTIIIFDEYCHPLFPEEGIAARRVLDTMKIAPQKSPYLPYTVYFQI